MCVTIVFAANIDGDGNDDFLERVGDLCRLYGYGIGEGAESLLPDARESVVGVLNDPKFIFEIHDMAEAHCACDIDQDIRNGSKLGTPSKFFDFVKEILEYSGLSTLSVLFFQEQIPEEGNVRRHMGTYGEFVDLLNRWNTWQIQGFEPTRQAYFVADESPLLFTFTEKQHLQ